MTAKINKDCMFIYTLYTKRYPDKMPQDKMPQCQKRTKCHNVDGEIRMQQKCNKGETWYNKDAVKLSQRCNMV